MWVGVTPSGEGPRMMKTGLAWTQHFRKCTSRQACMHTHAHTTGSAPLENPNKYVSGPLVHRIVSTILILRSWHLPLDQAVFQNETPMIPSSKQELEWTPDHMDDPTLVLVLKPSFSWILCSVQEQSLQIQEFLECVLHFSCISFYEKNLYKM